MYHITDGSADEPVSRSTPVLARLARPTLLEAEVAELQQSLAAAVLRAENAELKVRNQALHAEALKAKVAEAAQSAELGRFKTVRRPSGSPLALSTPLSVPLSMCVYARTGR